MKILYLITGLGGGGAEKIVCDLADNMVKNGHKVKIAYLTGSVIVRPENNSIELIYLNLNNVSSFYSAFKNYRKILSIFKPDVVHAHMVHANIFARLSRIFVKVPRLICTAHSRNEGGRVRMLAYRFTHNLSNITTNVSNDASQNFIKLKAVPVSGISTVYNGINLNKFNVIDVNNKNIRDEFKISDGAILFLAVGRFHEAKDYPNLIAAFSTLCKKYNDKNTPILLIAGDGDIGLIEDTKKLILENDLSSRVILLGRRNDISEIVNSSDFFVLSSKYEGLPTVLIEAMACKKFIISTDCGGSSEILGDTGVLVPTENSEALANAMLDALKYSKEDIRLNGLKARKRVEKLFSLEKSVQNWLNLYEQK